MRSILLPFACLVAACAGPETAPTPAPTPAPTSAPVAPAPQADPKPAPKPSRREVKIAAVGDVLPHEAVRRSAEAHNVDGADGKTSNHNGYDTLFERARVAFDDADIVFGNLETPIAPVHNRGTRPFVFNAPIAMLEAMKWAGFDVVSFANNHAYDQGRDGFVETLGSLESVGLLGAGAGRSMEDAYRPRIVEEGGMKLCFMAMARLLNSDLQPESASEPQLAYVVYGKKEVRKYALDAVAAARPGCDFLLVSIHWGTEYTISPASDDRALAKELLDAGADGILGHHPHVLQPLERYTTKDGRSAFIAFSMGNFVSNQGKNHKQPNGMDGHTRDSMVLRFSVKPREDGASGPQGILGDLGYYPAWTDREARPDEKGQKQAKVIRAVILDQEIKDADAALAALEGKTLSKEEKAAQAAWKARKATHTARKKSLAKVVGEEFVLDLK